MKLLLYFSDAFAWQYLEQRPFMEDFWRDRVPLHTILGYSSTVIPAIESGKPPRETGIWTEYYFERQESTMLERLVSRPRLAWLAVPANLARLIAFRITRRLGRPDHRMRVPLPVSNLFARHEIDYKRFPAVETGDTLADLFERQGLRVDFRFVESGLDPAAELARLRATGGESDVYFYYDPSLDEGGHALGADVEKLSDIIDAQAAFVEAATAELERFDDVDVLFFSDHGMATVETSYDIRQPLQDLRFGRDYVAFIDSTFARFWYRDDAVRDSVRARLTDVPGSFLTQQDQVEYALDFDDDRYGQDVVVADEGVVFHPNYFPGKLLKPGEFALRGMHGYRPEAPSSYGVALYRGAGRSEPLPSPIEATDLFDVVADLVRPTPADVGQTAHS